MIRNHGQNYVRYQGRHYRVSLAFVVPHYVCPQCNRCYPVLHDAHVHREKCATWIVRGRGSYTFLRNALNYTTRKHRRFSITLDRSAL